MITKLLSTSTGAYLLNLAQVSRVDWVHIKRLTSAPLFVSPRNVTIWSSYLLLKLLLYSFNPPSCVHSNVFAFFCLIIPGGPRHKSVLLSIRRIPHRFGIPSIAFFGRHLTKSPTRLHSHGSLTRPENTRVTNNLVGLAAHGTVRLDKISEFMLYRYVQYYCTQNVCSPRILRPRIRKLIYLIVLWSTETFIIWFH